MYFYFYFFEIIENEVCVVCVMFMRFLFFFIGLASVEADGGLKMTVRIAYIQQIL